MQIQMQILLISNLTFGLGRRLSNFCLYWKIKMLLIYKVFTKLKKIENNHFTFNFCLLLSGKTQKSKSLCWEMINMKRTVQI